MKTFVTWSAIGMAALMLLYGLAVAFVGPVRYETRFEVERPAAVAWAVFVDPARAAEWMPGLTSIETLEGQPLTVGSRFELTFEEDGSTYVMTETLTSVVPERELAFLMGNEVIEADVRVRFEEEGGRTAVVTTNEVRARGLLKPLMPLLRTSMIERQDEGYDRLKALIEAAPTAAPAAAPQGDTDEG